MITQFARQMAHQMAEEFDHLWIFDGAEKEPKVKVPQRHPRHRRRSFPVEVVLQHRGLSPRRGIAGRRNFGLLARKAKIPVTPLR